MREGEFESLDEIVVEPAVEPVNEPLYIASPIIVKPVVEIEKSVLLIVNIGIMILLLGSVIYNNHEHITIDNVSIGYLASSVFYGLISFHYYTISKHGIKSRYGLILFASINVFYISIIIVSFAVKINFIMVVELILLNYVFGAVLYGMFKAAIFLTPTGNIVKYLTEVCLCLISIMLIFIKK